MCIFSVCLFCILHIVVCVVSVVTELYKLMCIVCHSKQNYTQSCVWSVLRY